MKLSTNEKKESAQRICLEKQLQPNKEIVICAADKGGGLWSIFTTIIMKNPSTFFQIKIIMKRSCETV